MRFVTGRGGGGIAHLATLVCAAMLAAPAAAGPAIPQRLPPRGAEAAATARPPVMALLAGARMYDNTGALDTTYYDSQGGAEAIDDLHLAFDGAVDSVAFEYFDPAIGGTLSAVVRLYVNPGGLDLTALPLAGPFLIPGLPRGWNSVSLSLPPGSVTDGRSIWMGVRFTSTTAGLIVKSVPSTGSSHDYYMEDGLFYYFGGEPKANFAMRVVGTPTGQASVAEPDRPRATLAPAHPSPFRGETAIRYTIDRSGAVRLAVYDVSGRRVRTLVDDVREAGAHLERWPGRDDAGRAVPAGVYLVRLESASGAAFRRVVFAP